MIAARVFRTKDGKLIDKPNDIDTMVVEAAIRDRDEQYGVHVHTFNPNEYRDWWLITWPLELEATDAAEELLYFVLGMIPEGDIELPADVEDAPYVWATFSQPIVFSKRLAANGQYVDDEVRGIGPRFVVAS